MTSQAGNADTPRSEPLRKVTQESSEERWQRRYLLGAMIAIYTINYIDRSIINVLAQPIKRDLNLSDAALGMVSGMAFGVLYATMGLPFARLCERTSRVKLISLAIGVWSIMTAVCGLATNFWQLFFARLGVGIGEAGCNPTAQSMISDVYPPERRSTALAAYALGVPIGTLFGAFLGGWIGETLGWRYAFFILGLPGVALAFVVRKTVREPVRGGQDVYFDAAAAAPSLRQAINTLWQLRTFRHLVVGFTVCGTAFYALTTFIVAYVLRQFDVSLLRVSFMFGLISGVTGFLGLLLGGVVTDWLGGRDKRIYGWVPAAAHVLTAPLLLMALVQTSVTSLALYIVLPATFCLVYIGPGFAMTHNLVPPRIRATAVAVLVMISTLLGMSIGPTLVGLISDIATQSVFVGDFDARCGAGKSGAANCRNAEATGLRIGLMCASALYLWSAVHFVFAGRSYRSELASVDAVRRMAAPGADR